MRWGPDGCAVRGVEAERLVEQRRQPGRGGGADVVEHGVADVRHAGGGRQSERRQRRSKIRGSGLLTPTTCESDHARDGTGSGSAARAGSRTTAGTSAPSGSTTRSTRRQIPRRASSPSTWPAALDTIPIGTPRSRTRRARRARRGPGGTDPVVELGVHRRGRGGLVRRRDAGGARVGQAVRRPLREVAVGAGLVHRVRGGEVRPHQRGLVLHRAERRQQPAGQDRGGDDKDAPGIEEDGVEVTRRLHHHPRRSRATVVSAVAASRARRRAGPPRRGCGRRSCRSPPTGGCAPCPRTGAERAAMSATVAAVPGRPQHVGLARRSAGCRRWPASPRPASGRPRAAPAATRRTASASCAGRGVLDDEAARAGLHRPAQVAGPAERGHHEHAARGQRGAQGGGRGDAVEAGHLDVEQRDVGPGAAARRRPPRRRGRPRPPPRGRAPGRAARPARRARAPGRRRAAGGSRRRSPSTRNRQPARSPSAHGQRTTGGRDPLAQPGAGPAPAAGVGRTAAVVDDLDRSRADAGSRQCPRAAVPHHVRDPLPHHPAEQLLRARRERRRRSAGRSASIPAAAQRTRAPGQLDGERHLAVPADRRPARRRAPRGPAARRRRSRPRRGRGRGRSSRPASSALTDTTVSEWPSRSCRSRANRLRSASTASRAISSRAAASWVLRWTSWTTPHTASAAMPHLEGEVVVARPARGAYGQHERRRRERHRPAPRPRGSAARTPPSPTRYTSAVAERALADGQRQHHHERGHRPQDRRRLRPPDPPRPGLPARRRCRPRSRRKPDDVDDRRALQRGNGRRRWPDHPRRHVSGCSPGGLDRIDHVDQPDSDRRATRSGTGAR